MTHTEALALGILQGATEFLPVSSSGHLVLAEHFGQVQGAGLAFDVFLHLGTLLAVLIYFRKDWWAMFTFWRAEKTYQRLLFYLLLATVPGALVGFLGEDLVARHFRDPLRVAYLLILMSFPLLLAELWSPKNKELKEIKLFQALLIGCAQALAIFPGTSRSGITMATGLLLGFRREAAARFSFLLSAPIIAGAGAYESLKLVQNGEPLLPVYWTGFLAAFGAGFLVIAWLLHFLRRHTFYPFIIYRILLAGVIIGLKWLG